MTEHLLSLRSSRGLRRRRLRPRTDQPSLDLNAPSHAVAQFQDQFGRIHRQQVTWQQLGEIKAYEMQNYDNAFPEQRLRFERERDRNYQPIGPWK